MLRFDPTVNTGNVLVIVITMAGLLFAWFKMDSRVTMNEAMTSENRAMIKTLAEQTNKINLTQERVLTMLSIYQSIVPDDPEQLSLRRRQ